MFIEEERARRAEAEINNYGGLGRTMQAATEAAKVANNGKTEREEDVTWEFADTVVFKSLKDKGLEEDGRTAKDLLHHDKTKEQIKAMSPSSGIDTVLNWSEDNLRAEIRALTILMTINGDGMYDCVNNLFERFYTGKGEENIDDKILKKNLKNHHAVQAFITTTKEVIRKKLWSDACHGYLPGLHFDNSVRAWNLKTVKKDLSKKKELKFLVKK